MATRKEKLEFTKKRFIGFWNQFKRSKRGIIGLIGILIFCFVGIFAPMIAQYKPIDPQFNVGKYQGVGLSKGLPIAEKLCKPVWYKYLPWIARGETNMTESFYSFVYTLFGAKLQLFTLEEYYKPLLTKEQRLNYSDSVIRLTHRVASLQKVEAFLPNETTPRVLSEDIEWKMKGARALEITDYYPDETQFDVTYSTGVDLNENMEVVKDHMFVSSQSFNEWSWKANSTLADVNYNNQKGFKFKPTDQTEDSGCIQISYNQEGISSSNPIEVTIYSNFTFPYLQPPEKFWIHISVNGEGIRSCRVEPLFYSEKEATEYLVKSNVIALTGRYSPIIIQSTEPIVAKTVGVSPPQDKIFASSGNYKFGVRITFTPEEEDVNIYLDHVNCIFYGNIFGLFGTDNATPYPADIFSTLIYGSRVSLIVGILSAVFSTLIGLFLGLISGYVGGIVDEGVMRFADLLLVLPTLPLFIVLVTALRATSGSVSMWNIIFILTLFGWMSFARSVRSMVLSIRERAFIEAAKASGGGTFHIINRHIIPNVFALVYITLATAVPGAIITEASLSWLGLGDTRLASWGKILYDFNNSGVVTSKGLLEYWFWVFPACIAIALLAMSFILVGYALDEILNPRLRERR
jgi:ABC-type dipeptide/oligopeptide/nickel transport system permease subunit